MKPETKSKLMASPARTAEEVPFVAVTKDMGRYRVSVTVNAGEP